MIDNFDTNPYQFFTLLKQARDCLNLACLAAPASSNEAKAILDVIGRVDGVLAGETKQPDTAARTETETWEMRAVKEASRAHDLEQQCEGLLAAVGILADRLFLVPPGVDIALDAIRATIAKAGVGAVINAPSKQLAISHGSILRHRRYAAGLTASEAASLLGIGTIQLRFVEEGTIPAPADADTWYKFDKQGGAA